MMARNTRAGTAKLRAELVVRFACELLGAEITPDGGELRLELTVAQFQQALQARYGTQFPRLVFCDEDSIERARLDRKRFAEIPKVMLRRGAPRPRDAARARKRRPGLIDPLGPERRGRGRPTAYCAITTMWSTACPTKVGSAPEDRGGRPSATSRRSCR
ncbi:MAG: hypothetical protein U1F67_01075 [Rubrivivax sp.]